MDTSAQDMVFLTPTHVHEYLFCPRFTYFEYVACVPQHEEQRFKVQKGREVHEERQKVNPTYLRKKLGVVERAFDVRLQSRRLHLSGVVDEVLTLDDGTMAPFDYKFAEYTGRIYKGLEMQSTLYALLMRELYQKPVNRGFLCYTRSNYKVEQIDFEEEDFAEGERIVLRVLEVIQSGRFPPPTKSQAKCEDCCYRNLCVR